ncbi:MAG: type II toxin-antitoxin system VapC family toxin [Reyranella sp.]|uniref:type II toxin-antitoxin system VapC family toxin n=1 Tax=Reyranella sp. TaxID=1929291 RepID=UPI003D0E9DDA
MRLLLDTNAFLWWLAGHRSISKRVRSEFDTAGADVFVSAASAWEIATKHWLGKVPEAQLVARNVLAIIESQQFTALAASVLHGQTAGALAGNHRDPFDRLLIAQALVENLTLVSSKHTFDSYGIQR